MFKSDSYCPVYRYYDVPTYVNITVTQDNDIRLNKHKDILVLCK